jgi:hypothetical protein
MGEKVVLTWSVENWITVLLMVGIAALVAKTVSSYLAKNSGAS